MHLFFLLSLTLFLFAFVLGRAEAATRRVLLKKLFFKILQYSPENTRVGVFF